MDVVVIFNGLGNQMSQYAFYLQKKKYNDSTEYLIFCNEHNGLELNKIFNIHLENTLKRRLMMIPFRILLTTKLKILNQLVKVLNVVNYKIVKESFNYRFNKDHLSLHSGTTFYFGGWPSEKYFAGVKDAVRKTFDFKTPDDVANLELLKEIQATNSVAVHVRRGDYLVGDNINIFGGVCTSDYFKNAIARIEDEVKNPHYFVFSNDIPWVKENLKLKNVTYVTINSGENSWKDMFLMSRSKHNIISNSTFSWWGAWLNSNPNKIVISPDRYLNSDTETDFYPEKWERVSSYSS